MVKNDERKGFKVSKESKKSKCPHCEQECVLANHICDVDDVVQELESFRINLPLHTRGESMPVCNLVIGKLHAMDAEITKYKTTIESIFRLSNPDHHRDECECWMCKIGAIAQDALYGDGKQDKVEVPIVGSCVGGCSTCLHDDVKLPDDPCGTCSIVDGEDMSNWQPKN